MICVATTCGLISRRALTLALSQATYPVSASTPIYGSVIGCAAMASPAHVRQKAEEAGLRFVTVTVHWTLRSVLP